MKKLILIISIMFSNFVYAKCKLDLDSFYFQGLKGERTISDDRTKFITVYPKYESIDSEYEEDMHLFVSIKDICEIKNPILGSIEIYRMIGKDSYKMIKKNGNEVPDGNPNEANWEKKPYITVKKKFELKDGMIMVPKIPVKKIVEENLKKGEHVWKFKVVIRDIFSPSPNVIIVDHVLSD